MNILIKFIDIFDLNYSTLNFSYKYYWQINIEMHV